MGKTTIGNSKCEVPVNHNKLRKMLSTKWEGTKCPEE